MKERIVGEAYRAFGSFVRPDHFTDYKHCCECSEHDELMRSRPLAEVGIAELNNPGWCPLPFLTEQAYGYVMPRLIEIVLSEPDFVFCYLLAVTHQYRKLDYFTREQTAAVLESLHYIRDHMRSQVEMECCEDDLGEAIEKWRVLHESRS